MSIRQAARAAGISDARWRQVEHGVRYFRGVPYPEAGPAQVVARMAAAVGVTAAELAAAGRPDAAAELASLPASPAPMTAIEELRAATALVRHWEAVITKQQGPGGQQQREEGDAGDQRMAQ